MKRNVLDFVAHQRRHAERREGFRACGWMALRDAVTEASRAVNHLTPLHLVSEDEIAGVADHLDHCRQLALAMLKKGRQRGR